MDTRPSLAIRLKRHADGSVSITLACAAWTATWQRQNGSLGGNTPARRRNATINPVASGPLGAV